MGDLSGWDTSNVTNMSGLFFNSGSSATTWSIGDLSGWDTSNVTNMAMMFSTTGRNATSWSVGDLSGWDTSNVTKMNSMFYYAGHDATNFSLDISGWDTSNVTNMYYMFYKAGYNATSFNLDISGWDTSNVTNAGYMFNSAGCNATNFSLDISGWNTIGVTSVDDMFTGSGLANVGSSITVGANVKRNVLDQLPTKLGCAWINTAGEGYQPTEIPEGMADTYTLGESYSTMLPQDTWYKSSVEKSDIKEIHFVTEFPYSASGYAETWDASEKQDGSIPCAVTNDNILYISSNGAAKVFANVDSSKMFKNFVSSTEIENTALLDTAKVENMNNMFERFGYGPNSGSYIKLDLSSWDTSNVTTMSGIFLETAGNYPYSTQKILKLDIGNWDTSNVASTIMMFVRSAMSTPNSSITVGTNVKRNVLDQLPSDINRYAWRSKTTGTLYMKPTEIPEGVADTYEFLDFTGGEAGAN